MLAHLSGDVCQDLMLVVVELYPEHRVREWLDHRRFDLDGLFFLGQTSLFF
jgi:hypothetical protein